MIQRISHSTLFKYLAYFILTAAGILFFITIQNFNPIERAGILWSSFVTIYVLYEGIKTIYNTWIGQALGHNIEFLSVGKWALVTGATDGIGKAYCKYLAKRGLNIVLVSRTESKLQNVCEELEAKFEIETKYIVADFTKGEKIYEEIENALKSFDIEIGTLINNVAISYPTMEYFLEVEGGGKYHQEMINCNILSAVRMTYLLLPEMVQRKKGIVINVGSATYFEGFPFLTVYSSTKAFLSNLTNGLALEYKDQGIHFQFLCPAYVTTKMSRISKSSLHVPNPDEFVEVAGKTIGLQTKTSAWVPHRLVIFLLKWNHQFFPSHNNYMAFCNLRQVWLNTKRSQFKKIMADAFNYV